MCAISGFVGGIKFQGLLLLLVVSLLHQCHEQLLARVLQLFDLGFDKQFGCFEFCFHCKDRCILPVNGPKTKLVHFFDWFCHASRLSAVFVNERVDFCKKFSALFLYLSLLPSVSPDLILRKFLKPLLCNLEFALGWLNHVVDLFGHLGLELFQFNDGVSFEHVLIGHAPVNSVLDHHLEIFHSFCKLGGHLLHFARQSHRCIFQRNFLEPLVFLKRVHLHINI